MTGFEPQTSGIGSDHPTNWATTTALENLFILPLFCFVYAFLSLYFSSFTYLCLICLSSSKLIFSSMQHAACFNLDSLCICPRAQSITFVWAYLLALCLAAVLSLAAEWMYLRVLLRGHARLRISTATTTTCESVCLNLFLYLSLSFFLSLCICNFQL